MVHRSTATEFDRDKRTTAINGKLNEGATEYLAEEICKANGISYNPSRQNLVKPLRNLAKAMNVSDMELAVVLNNTNYSQKYSTLKSLVETTQTSHEEKEVMRQELSKLYGALKK